MSSPGYAGQACRSRVLDVIAWVTLSFAIALVITLTVGWSDISLVLGVISFLVLVYVVFTACRAALARARRDKAEIENAHSLLRQCMALVDMIEQALGMLDRERVNVMLDQLYGRVGLFLTKYGQYMRPEAADIVWEMENSIADAKFRKQDDLLLFTSLMRESLGSVQSKILDVDDRTLHALRSKM